MKITLQPGDSAEGFSLSGGGEDDVWFLLVCGCGGYGGVDLFFLAWGWIFSLVIFYKGVFCLGVRKVSFFSF